MEVETFGSMMRIARRNARDPLNGGPISQNRLADLLSDDIGIVYSRAAISDWERGKGHIHKDDRPVLISLIRVLHGAGGLPARPDAERWLTEGNYRALDSAEAAAINPAWNATPGPTAGQRPFLPPLLPHHPIIGRDEFLAQLKSWLFDGRSLALSSINGLPGVGKTALALLAAHDEEVQKRFPDGVLWVGLGTNPDIFALLGAWAKAVGISEDELAGLGAQRMRSEAIHEVIRHKEMLLVIDDVWHSEQALPFRLGGGHSAHILTSRQPPIAAAFAGRQAMTVRELSPRQGLDLLRWLAPQVVERDEAAARDLVATTGGLPLALVLLGNRLRLYGLSGSDRRMRSAMQALAEAEARLTLAQPASPLASDQHPSLAPGIPLTLGAIIQALIDRLSAEAAAALHALALFPPKPNHFSETAALAVANVPTDTLDELVDHGLLEPTRRDRYTLHQSIHDYARLHQPDLTEAIERCLAYIQSFIEENQDDRPALEQELENITAALQLAEAGGQQATLWALLEALLPFFNDRGYYDVALKMLEQLDRASAVVSPAVKQHLGHLEIVLEHVDAAQAHLESGLAAARLAGDHAMAGRMLTSLSQIASQQLRFADAVAYLEEAAQAAEAEGDWFEVSRALGNSGRVASLGSDFAGAERYYRRALAVAREHGFDSLISGILNLLGIVASDTGRREEALQFYREGLDVSRAHRLDGRTTLLLTNIGGLLNDMGRHVEAEAYLEEGIAIADRLGDVGLRGHMLMDLGVAAAAQGRYAEATGYMEESYAIAASRANPWQEADAAACWGTIALDAGDTDRARELLETAVRMAPDIASSAQVEGLARLGLARLALAAGDSAAADDQSARALAVLENTGHGLAAEVAAWRAAAGFIAPVS